MGGVGGGVGPATFLVYTTTDGSIQRDRPNCIRTISLSTNAQQCVNSRSNNLTCFEIDIIYLLLSIKAIVWDFLSLFQNPVALHCVNCFRKLKKKHVIETVFSFRVLIIVKPI